MRYYSFNVYDDDGCWGNLRQKASSAKTAKRKCIQWLRDEAKSGRTTLNLRKLKLKRA
jgi:hypothetical protein